MSFRGLTCASCRFWQTKLVTHKSRKKKKNQPIFFSLNWSADLKPEHSLSSLLSAETVTSTLHLLRNYTICKYFKKSLAAVLTKRMHFFLGYGQVLLQKHFWSSSAWLMQSNQMELCKNTKFPHRFPKAPVREVFCSVFTCFCWNAANVIYITTLWSCFESEQECNKCYTVRIGRLESECPVLVKPRAQMFWTIKPTVAGLDRDGYMHISVSEKYCVPHKVNIFPLVHCRK